MDTATITIIGTIVIQYIILLVLLVGMFVWALNDLPHPDRRWERYYKKKRKKGITPERTPEWEKTNRRAFIGMAVVSGIGITVFLGGAFALALVLIRA